MKIVWSHTLLAVSVLASAGPAAAEDPRNHVYDENGRITTGAKPTPETTEVVGAWGREIVVTAPEREEEAERDTRGRLSLDPAAEYAPKIRRSSGRLTRNKKRSWFAGDDVDSSWRPQSQGFSSGED